MYGGAFPAGGLAGNNGADTGGELDEGAANGNIALMVVQAFHDVHDANLAVVGCQVVHQQAQRNGAGQRQDGAGKNVQLFKRLGAVARQEVLEWPFDGQAKSQNHATGKQAG